MGKVNQAEVQAGGGGEMTGMCGFRLNCLSYSTTLTYLIRNKTEPHMVVGFTLHTRKHVYLRTEREEEDSKDRRKM